MYQLHIGSNFNSIKFADAATSGISRADLHAELRGSYLHSPIGSTNAHRCACYCGTDNYLLCFQYFGFL
jgi:hypothetical protein